MGQERTLNIALQPASMTTEVNVSGGDLAALETTSAALGTNVSAREVAQLPINGRQVSQLYLMAPGATNFGSGTFDDIRFNGRSNEENAVRFDGIEAGGIISNNPGNFNGEVTGVFRLQASLENVQEFRVDSSNYPAGVRHRNRRADQRHHQERRQCISRQRVRIRSQRRAGRAQFLRRRQPVDSAAQSIRRLAGRADREETSCSSSRVTKGCGREHPLRLWRPHRARQPGHRRCRLSSRFKRHFRRVNSHRLTRCSTWLWCKVRARSTRIQAMSAWTISSMKSTSCTRGTTAIKAMGLITQNSSLSYLTETAVPQNLVWHSTSCSRRP